MSKQNIKTAPVKVMSEIDGQIGTIWLYGVIGQGQYAWTEEEKELALTDVAVLKKVKELEKEGCTRCNVRINSPGGLISHGDGIMAAFNSSKMEMHVYVDGIAASMAADIWLNFKKANRHVNSNSKIMIHAPLSGVYGNAKAHREAAEMLDTFADAAISRMAVDTGMKEDDVRTKYYDGGNHWFSAKAAVEIGFVDKVDDYEVEMIVENPEKMNYSDLVKSYEQPSKAENGFTNLGNDISKTTVDNLPQKNIQIEDMKIEDITKACDAGTLDKTALLAELNKSTNPAPTPEPEPTPPAAPKKSMQEMITEAVTAANAPLKAEIDALKAAPGATPEEGKLPEADEAFKGLDEEQIKAKKELDALNKSFEKTSVHARFKRY